MLVVNLYAGPCAGKSTLAASVFAKLKQSGIESEYCHEWIKWELWKNNDRVVDDQLYIFAAQHRMLHALSDKVQVAVCDSPLLLSLVYGKIYPTGYLKDSAPFFDLVRERYRAFDNLDYFINRKFGYNRTGRKQDEEAAIALDDRIKEILQEEGVKTKFVDPGADAACLIINDIRRKIQEKLTKK